MSLICNVHNEVINKLINIEEYANNAIKVLNNTMNEVEDVKFIVEINKAINEIKDVTNHIPDCIDEIEIAKVMGKHMNNRLQEYHDTIQNLGFKRER